MWIAGGDLARRGIVKATVDTKSKLLIAAFFVIVVAATVLKYDTFVIRHDYLVYDQVACDPTEESCFAYECEEGDEECDDTPFKKVEKNVRNTALCPNYLEGTCEPLSCGPDEDDCTETTFTEDALEEGELCIGPEDVEPEPSDVPEETGESEEMP